MAKAQDPTLADGPAALLAANPSDTAGSTPLEASPGGRAAAGAPTFPDSPPAFANAAATDVPYLDSEATEIGEANRGGKAPAMQAGIPSMVGKYPIAGMLGRGGMGVVLRARDPHLNRPVAIKLLLAPSFASPEARGRFQREAEIAASLQHPQIVQAYEAGVWTTADGQELPYLVQEFVDGPNLAQRLGGKPMKPHEAAALMAGVAEAVGFAHSRGVVHRDLKPANVLMAPDGVAKVADFGLAKRVAEDEEFTRSGAVMGTPRYMAPEAIAGLTRESSPAADVFALGAMLFECLAGRPAFDGATPDIIFWQVTEVDPPGVQSVVPGVPLDLDTIVRRCLAKQPQQRYADGAALAADLRRFLDGQPVLARRPGLVESAWRWCRRRPLAAGLTAGLAAALLGGMAAVSVLWVRAEEARRLAEEGMEKARRHAAAAMKGLDLAATSFAVDDALARQSSLSAAQQNFLQTAIELYAAAANDLADSGSAAARGERAMCWFRLAKIHQQLGNTADAELAFETAQTMAEECQARFGTDKVLSLMLTQCGIRLLQIYSNRRDWRKADELAAKLIRLYPEKGGSMYDQTRLATLHGQHGLSMIYRGDVSRAEELMDRTRSLLADALRRIDAGEADGGDSIDAAEAASEGNFRLRLRNELGRSLVNLGNIHAQLRRFDEAGEEFQSAVAHFESALKSGPATAALRQDLAAAVLNVAQVKAARRDLKNAVENARRAAALAEELAREFPNNPHFAVTSVQYQAVACEYARGLVGAPALEPEARELRRRAEALLQTQPNNILVRCAAGRAAGILATAKFVAGCYDEALAELDAGLEALLDGQRDPKVAKAAAQFEAAVPPAMMPERQNLRAMLWLGRCNVLEQLGRKADAEEAVRIAKQLSPALFHPGQAGASR